MEDKNLKTESEEDKIEGPPLIQEAAELRGESDHVSAEAHVHAGLAYLFELILSDKKHAALSEKLMSTFKTEPSLREDVGSLAKLLKHEASALHMHPVLLAMAMIWWGREADLAENETVGSADWQLLPISIRNHRMDLQEEFRLLISEIEDLFRGVGLEPEIAVQLSRKKCQSLNHGLGTLLKSIKGHRDKRKRLFYDCTKSEITAYYLLRVKKLKIDTKEVVHLLSEAGEKYDLNDKKDRYRAQRKVHGWAEAFETLIDALMLDLGYVRKKRVYVECADLTFVSHE